MLNFLNLILVGFLINFTSSFDASHVESFSKLNTIELENYKYQIDIDNEMKVDSNYYRIDPRISNDHHDLGYIQIRSKYGQLYECRLPDKQDGFEDDLDDSDDETLTSYFGGHPLNEKELDQKSQFNFTIIDEKINRFKADLGNTCIYRNLGWWTYELCFGRFVTQYHVQANGTIMGEKISLGNFSSDFNWLEANKTNMPVSLGILNHEQYYENGSMCELNGKQRKTVVKIFCDETVKTQIDLISEVETCVYEINVLSSAVCKIPNFSKKSNEFDIKCNPVLSMDQYQKYIKKKDEINIQKSLMKARLDFIQLEKEQEEKRKREQDQPEISIPKSVFEKQQEITDIDEQKLKIESIHNEITSELGKTANTFTNINQNAKKFKTILNKVEENVLASKGDANEENKHYLGEAQKILTEQVEDFLKTDQALDSLTNQLNNFIDDLNLDDVNLEGDNWDQLKKFEVDNQILSEKLNKVIEKSQSDLKELDKDATDTASKVNTGEEDEKLIEQVGTLDSDEKLKTLEEKIVASLSKSSKLAEKFKSGDIKIKIISFNPMSGDDQDESLKNLLNGLFDKNEEYEKLQKLKSNYEIEYDSEKHVMIESGEKENDDGIQSDNVYFDESDQNEKNENEKFIVY